MAYRENAPWRHQTLKALATEASVAIVIVSTAMAAIMVVMVMIPVAAIVGKTEDRHMVVAATVVPMMSTGMPPILTAVTATVIVSSVVRSRGSHKQQRTNSQRDDESQRGFPSPIHHCPTPK